MSQTTALHRAGVTARPAIRSSALARLIGYLVLIDILILPYFPYLVMPLSLPFIVLWAVCRLEIHMDRELRLFTIFAVCVLASTGLSFLFRDPITMSENVKRAGQLLTSFAYYFFFRHLAKDKRFNPSPPLMAYIIYYGAWVAYFFVAPYPATILQQRVYTAVAWIGEQNLIFYRFSYMFADPNTSGYLAALVGVYLLAYGRIGSVAKAFVVVVTFAGVLATGSRGALLALIIVAALHFWRSGILGRHLFRFALAGVVVLVVMGAAFRWYAARHTDEILRVTHALEALRTRVSGGTERTWQEVAITGEDSAAGDRIGIYGWMIRNLEPLPLGRGYVILGSTGLPYPPHSDIFRVLYSYGFVALIAVWLLCFRDVRYLAIGPPAFMAFAVNTLIDEQKLFVAFLILLAIARVEWERSRRKPGRAPLEERIRRNVWNRRDLPI